MGMKYDNIHRVHAQQLESAILKLTKVGDLGYQLRNRDIVSVIKNLKLLIISEQTSQMTKAELLEGAIT